MSANIFNLNAKPLILMRDPGLFYRIENPNENEFSRKGHAEYLKDPAAFAAAAQKEWQGLKTALTLLNQEVIALPPDPGSPNNIFAADPFLSQRKADGKLVVICSSFTNIERQVEVAAYKDFFSARMKPGDTMVTSPFPMEGTGDNIYDRFRDVFWSGFADGTPSPDKAGNGRTDKRAHAFLSETTGVEVIGLKVRKPFYHIDTPFSPLHSGHVLSYKDGMDPGAYKKMVKNAFNRFGLSEKDYHIKVSQQDAYAFGCNTRNVKVSLEHALSIRDLFTAFPANPQKNWQNSVVVMPEVSRDLQAEIASKGYGVVTLPLTHLLYSGGAGKCASNEAGEPRIVGGIAGQQGITDRFKAGKTANSAEKPVKYASTGSERPFSP